MLANSWVYRIFTGKYVINIAQVLNMNTDKVTQSSIFGLLTKRYCCDLKKFWITARTVNNWNSLPNNVVDIDSVDLFKSWLTGFWKHQDVRYNNKTELTRTEDRFGRLNERQIWNKSVLCSKLRYRHRGTKCMHSSTSLNDWLTELSTF